MHVLCVCVCVHAHLYTTCIWLQMSTTTGDLKTLSIFSKKDLRKALEEIGEKVDETQLRDLIAEVDVNQNSTIEEEEFLMVTNTPNTIMYNLINVC